MRWLLLHLAGLFSLQVLSVDRAGTSCMQEMSADIFNTGAVGGTVGAKAEAKHDGGTCSSCVPEHGTQLRMCLPVTQLQLRAQSANIPSHDSVQCHQLAVDD